MHRLVPALALIILLLAAGCTAPAADRPGAAVTQTLEKTGPATPVPVKMTETVTTAIPATTATAAVTVTTKRTAPVPTTISETSLNARIVDARNKLNNLIDSDVADTKVIYPDKANGCDVKQSRELGYLIDANTGESTFIKGDYGSIGGDLIVQPMNRAHEYVIIHTHPRMWATCQGAGIVSLYTFSIADLDATADLTEHGYHVKYLIAIADKEYRIWPKTPGTWKSSGEIRQAIARIERRYETHYAYYDPVLDREYFEVDSLMPLLAKELDYSYTADNHEIA